MLDKTKSAPKPLYVYRPVKNAAKIISWFKAQGLKTTLPADDMHVTLIYSKSPVDWMKMGGYPSTTSGDLTIPEGGPRVMEAFGPDKSATVLLFYSPDLKWRNSEMREGGASSDFQEYNPHITITYQRPADLPIENIEPYKGEIVLGPECFEDIVPNASDNIMEKVDQPNAPTTVIKVDEEQRMVYGWASVVTEKGQPVIDLQYDVIKPDVMVKAATEFMTDVRNTLVMHSRTPDGKIDPSMIKGMVVHSLPLTIELAKSLGIQTDREGWIVGVKVLDNDAWAQVKAGGLKAFSIGGTGDRVEASLS